jgi:hypothetical protein
MSEERNLHMDACSRQSVGCCPAKPDQSCRITVGITSLGSPFVVEDNESGEVLFGAMTKCQIGRCPASARTCVN